MRILMMSIDGKTKSEKWEIFAKKILPALPFVIAKNKKRYKIEVADGRIVYKKGHTILVETSGECNYDAGVKMLDWIENHDFHYSFVPDKKL